MRDGKSGGGGNSIGGLSWDSNVDSSIIEGESNPKPRRKVVMEEGKWHNNSLN